MKTIHKFPIPVEDVFDLKLPPKHWAPLTVQLQGQQPCLWVMLDDAQEKEWVRFELRGTGDNCIYLTMRMYCGTFQVGSLVFHLFCTTPQGLAAIMPLEQ